MGNSAACLRASLCQQQLLLNENVISKSVKLNDGGEMVAKNTAVPLKALKMNTMMKPTTDQHLQQQKKQNGDKNERRNTNGSGTKNANGNGTNTNGNGTKNANGNGTNTNGNGTKNANGNGTNANGNGTKNANGTNANGNGTKNANGNGRNAVGNGKNANGNGINVDGIIGGELTLKDKEIIARCWRKYIVTDRRDLFHKTMLRCIEASPKLNEIIACGRYCYRDLTKWPKLNRICQAQFKFYERLIYELNMDERRMRVECTRLGRTHAEYAQFGLKPHFLDIYQHSLLAIISKLEFGDRREKEETVQAFGRLISFIIDGMITGYGKGVCESRKIRRDSCATEKTMDE